MWPVCRKGPLEQAIYHYPDNPTIRGSMFRMVSIYAGLYDLLFPRRASARLINVSPIRRFEDTIGVAVPENRREMLHGNLPVDIYQRNYKGCPVSHITPAY